MPQSVCRLCIGDGLSVQCIKRELAFYLAQGGKHELLNKLSYGYRFKYSLIGAQVIENLRPGHDVVI